MNEYVISCSPVNAISPFFFILAEVQKVDLMFFLMSGKSSGLNSFGLMWYNGNHFFLLVILSCGQMNERSYVFNNDIFYLLYFQVWYVDQFWCFGHLFEETCSWQWISRIYILLDFRYFMAFLWRKIICWKFLQQMLFMYDPIKTR